MTHTRQQLLDQSSAERILEANSADYVTPGVDYSRRPGLPTRERVAEWNRDWNAMCEQERAAAVAQAAVAAVEAGVDRVALVDASVVDVEELARLAKAASEQMIPPIAGRKPDWYSEEWLMRSLCDGEPVDAAFIAASNPHIVTLVIGELRRLSDIKQAIHDLAENRLREVRLLQTPNYWQHDMREIERLTR